MIIGNNNRNQNLDDDIIELAQEDEFIHPSMQDGLYAPYNEYEEPKANKFYILVGSFVAFALMGGALLFAYNAGVKDGTGSTVPVIRADNSKVKDLPKDPGGKEIPFQNARVLNDITQKVENLDFEKANSALNDDGDVDIRDVISNFDNRDNGKAGNKAEFKEGDVIELRTNRGSEKETVVLSQNGEVLSRRPMDTDNKTVSFAKENDLSKILTPVVVVGKEVNLGSYDGDSNQGTMDISPQNINLPKEYLSDSNSDSNNQNLPEAVLPFDSSARLEADPIADKIDQINNTDNGIIAINNKNAGNKAVNITQPVKRPNDILPKKVANLANEVDGLAIQNQKPNQISGKLNNNSKVILDGSIKGNGYLVQIASHRTEAAALDEFRRLSKKHKIIFANAQPIIERADLGAKGIYYRLKVGPLSSKEIGNSICSTIGKNGCPIRLIK